MTGHFSFFSGYRRLRISASDSTDLLNLCAEGHFVYRDPRLEGDFFLFSASETVSKRLIPAMEKRGIGWECVREGGSALWLRRLLHRPGILLGALLFALTVFCSSSVIWDIRVEGCHTLREEEVERLLGECGLHLGAWRSSLDAAGIESRVIIASDEISWITVNIIGTVAEVEIRESAPAPDAPSEMAAANLVAARDGLILWMEEVRGNAAVAEGDDVAEGELLVGGLYGSETDGFRYTVAKGRVYAKTHRDFSVEIPLTYEKKTYTGRMKVEKYFIFFEKEVKFFGNYGNLYTSCDTIDTVEYFHIWDGEHLPIGVRTVRYLEYTLIPTTRSEEEAKRLAEYELRCLAEAEVPGGELLRMTKRGSMSETAYRLTVHASYIENIATVREIEIEGITKKQEP